jgi:hypothetical protein
MSEKSVGQSSKFGPFVPPRLSLVIICIYRYLYWKLSLSHCPKALGCMGQWDTHFPGHSRHRLRQIWPSTSAGPMPHKFSLCAAALLPVVAKDEAVASKEVQQRANQDTGNVSYEIGPTHPLNQRPSEPKIAKNRDKSIGHVEAQQA